MAVARHHLGERSQLQGPHMLGDEHGVERFTRVQARQQRHHEQRAGQADDETEAGSAPAEVAPGPAPH